MATDTSTSQQSNADVATRTDSGSLHHQKSLIEITAVGGEPAQITRASSPMPVDDPSIEVSRGLITGQTPVIIRGHNPTQTAASGFVDVSEFGDLTYLTSAETMEIASSSTDDDGSPAGIGLQTVLVEGVDGTGAAVSETITMNGTTDVTTSNSYLRVNVLKGLAVGSSGWNVGSVTATATTAATVQCEMDATEGLSQNSHYTVPLGKTLYLMSAELNSAKISGGGSPELEFKLYVRVGGAGNCWLQLFDKTLDTGVTDELDVFWRVPEGCATARSDLRFRTDTDTNSTECRTRLSGILIDD